MQVVTGWTTGVTNAKHVSPPLPPRSHARLVLPDALGGVEEMELKTGVGNHGVGRGPLPLPPPKVLPEATQGPAGDSRLGLFLERPPRIVEAVPSGSPFDDEPSELEY